MAESADTGISVEGADEHADVITEDDKLSASSSSTGIGAVWSSRDSYHVELRGSELPPWRRSFMLKRELFDRLLHYQRSGVAWMAGLYGSGKGGILADDMGLGKTVQICALLEGLRAAGATHALALVPVTLLDLWQKEAVHWCPSWNLYMYHGTTTQRASALRGIMRAPGGILLTTYSLFSHCEASLSSVVSRAVDNAEPVRQQGRRCRQGRKRQRAASTVSSDDGNNTRPCATPPSVDSTRPWDVVICDEAHKLKNISTLIGRSVRCIKSRCRLLLSGTPVQNSLQDLWALMDFAQPGLLGNLTTFVKQFSEPIAHGSVRNASPYAAGLKRHLSEQLWQLIEPHLLRRTKMSVGLLADDLGQAGGGGEEANGDRAPRDSCRGQDQVADMDSKHALPPKNETIVWLMPTAEQIIAYKKVLAHSEVVRDAVSGAKMGLEAFRAIGLLKRLCNHPMLALSNPSETLAHLDDDCEVDAIETKLDSTDGIVVSVKEEMQDAAAPSGVISAVKQESRDSAVALDSDVMLSQSAKLRCLSSLLPALASRGHNTLVFAQGVRMLDLVESCILKPRGMQFLRIDGQTSIPMRAQKVRDFQTQPERFPFMLLTTGVGGFGLNLTSANRVILMDPAWNPATDAQSVDRTFRIGQRREVRVYRLVMSGLIEDKMLRLQVFKMGLTRTALEAQHQRQYFTSREIRGLFDWTDPAEGETKRLLSEKNGEDGLAMTRAIDDGAEEGWLKAGPALGLSDFAKLFQTFQNADEDESSKQMIQIRERLSVADVKIQHLAETREASEVSVETRTKAFEAATQHAAAAAATRAKAEAVFDTKMAELEKLKRLDPAFKVRCELAGHACAAALQKQFPLEQSKREADDAAAMTEHNVLDARGALAASERGLQDSILCIEQLFGNFDDQGKAVKGGLVDAAATGLRVTKHYFEQTRQLLTEVGTSHRKLETIEAGLASTDAITESQRCADLRGSDARMIEKQRDEAQRCTERARGQLSEVMSSFAKASLAWTDSFQKVAGRRVLSNQVKAIQDSAGTTFQRFTVECDSVKAAHESWMKAVDLRRYPARCAVAAAATYNEANRHVTEAERARNEVVTEAENHRSKWIRSETDAKEADATRRTAAAEEVEWKRKRDQLMATVGAEYLGVLRSRAAEQDAITGREALHVQCSKDDQMRLHMEVARSTAVEALRAEAYDTRQVEEAYHAKKKHKPEVSTRL